MFEIKHKNVFNDIVDENKKNIIYKKFANNWHI